ncbi:MAG TPA: DinB family protein [Actinomycetota bacterium]|nr:DinB family protein [Actinomycetota bacterium]
MITSIAAFIRWFEGVNRRAMRDIGGLPQEAEGWRPTLGEGEKAWSIGEIVGHMSVSRLFFLSTFMGPEWSGAALDMDTTARASWTDALQRSCEIVTETLATAPDEYITRKIPMLDGSGREMSGWRPLMLMAEHDIHHRSQIDTYAGMNGWEVSQIFGRSAEQVGLGAEQATQRQD